MTNHPITPPPELVDEWRRAPEYTDDLGKLTMVAITVDRLQYIATQAAQYGADQELEACCKWVEKTIPSWAPHALNEQLRAARRPKPPSLKEQALEQLDRIPTHDNEGRTWGVDVFTIRRALEALDD